ncbi:MAG TPA: hypothetical protein VEM96_00830 [Pyrinomonadaceae bacterium]|nr:hypothetical protein [Pyrinomonadaceae bacterium]
MNVRVDASAPSISTVEAEECATYSAECKADERSKSPSCIGSNNGLANQP